MNVQKPEPEVVFVTILEKKANFYVFLGIFNARCYRSRRSIFGPKSYFTELNIWGKIRGLNTMKRVGQAPDAILGHLNLK